MISDDIWKNYIDTGYVTEEILDHMVTRIKKGKRMSIREKQIYITYSTQIEERLRR